MGKVLLSAGLICLLYFVILCLKGVDFCIIWLLAACFLGAWGGYLVYRMKNPAGFQLPGFFVIIFLIFVILVGGSFLYTEGKIILAMTQKPEDQLEYVIVLGAQVKKTKVSKALRLRLETAEQYLKEHPDTLAVLSGGQGEGEEITEAQCMYEWLIDAGIPEERLLLEDASTTTKENLEYSEAVIEKNLRETGREEKKPKECRIALVSNNFHIYRAIRLAKKQGYSQVTGIAAPGDYKLQIHYMVREYFALIQAIIRGDI